MNSTGKLEFNIAIDEDKLLNEIQEALPELIKAIVQDHITVTLNKSSMGILGEPCDASDVPLKDSEDNQNYDYFRETFIEGGI